jgi:predicted DNA-binding protein
VKTGTVTIRLPEEKIAELQEMAKAKGCTLSELVREQVLAKMEDDGKSGVELSKRVEEVAETIINEQRVYIDLLITILRNTVGARYHASLATTYADDMITMMQTGNVLSEGEAERRQAVREKEALRIEEATVAQALSSKTKRRV